MKRSFKDHQMLPMPVCKQASYSIQYANAINPWSYTSPLALFSTICPFGGLSCMAHSLQEKVPLLHHESSCASQLAARAQCLKSHKTSCVFLLVALAKVSKTQVKMRFPISRACQVSQLTWIKLRFPCGSACQVSQQIKCIHIQVDCWIHTTSPEPIATRFGWFLIVECLFDCRQARLKFGRFLMSIFHQCQHKSKLNHVNPYANISTKSHYPFWWRQFPVYCQIHLLVGFWESTCSANHLLRWIFQANCCIKSCGSILWRKIDWLNWKQTSSSNCILLQPLRVDCLIDSYLKWSHQPNLQRNTETNHFCGYIQKGQNTSLANNILWGRLGECEQWELFQRIWRADFELTIISQVGIGLVGFIGLAGVGLFVICFVGIGPHLPRWLHGPYQPCWPQWQNQCEQPCQPQ